MFVDNREGSGLVSGSSWCLTFKVHVKLKPQEGGSPEGQNLLSCCKNAS